MRRPILLLALVLLALLGAMAAKGLLVRVPPVRTHSGPAEFDANRAKARLAAILGDQRPHPADTAADDAVRGRIVALLQGMGLRPVVRDQFACNELYKQRGVSCARVHNIIAVLGSARGKAVLLNAHYDSTPVGPGASDDGIGVATLLEVAERLKNRPLRRPVMLLFNEGEELGLVGARAFLADPVSRNVDSLVNLEARGVRGPVNMFETSRPNGTPIAVFKRSVHNPIANSLSTDVYRLLPNYTDVNSFSERGWLTLNLAPIGNETRYHSPGDDVAALDPATLQHMGDQTLALAETLANRPPPAESSDRIFMDLGGRSLLTLPLMFGAVLLALLLAAFAAISWRRGGIALGLAVSAATMIGSGTVAFVALALVGLIRPGMFWRAEALWTHLATYASVMLVAVVALALSVRRVTVPQLRAAYWLFFLVVGLLIGLLAPGGIIFFLFPALLALVGIAVSRWWKPAETTGAATAILVLFGTWGAMLGLLEELLNTGPMWAFAPLGSLLILPVLIEGRPLIGQIRLRTSAALAGTLAFVGWAAALVAPAYSADREQRFVVQHVTDASSGKASWSLLNDGAPLATEVRELARWKRGKLPLSERPRWLATAPPNGARAPALQLVAQVRNGTERTLVLRIVANGWSEIELLAPENSKIRSAGVGRFVRPIDQNEDGKYFLDCSGRSCDGALLQLTTGQLKPIALLVIGSGRPLPPSAASLIAARPRLARAQYTPDEAIAFTRAKF